MGVRDEKTRAAPSGRPRSGSVVKSLKLSAVCFLVLLSACSIFEPDFSYHSNRDLFEAISRRTAFAVDEDFFELYQAEIREDSLTLFYRGVACPGDEAWVLRFSQKSTEQDPLALADVYKLVPIVSEGRTGFVVEKEDSQQIGAATLSYVIYSFESPIRDGDNKPLTGRGIVATLARDQSGLPVVYYLNLHNLGDRDKLDVEAVRPFIDAMVR